MPDPLVPAAVYTRFSSDNQSDTSLADQAFACERWAKDKGFLIIPDHTYSDAAVSGMLRNREGLSALMAAGQQRCFRAVLVYDLSRLSRNLSHLLDIVARLRFLSIAVWSVTDGINTLDDEAILNYQIRGAFNEHYINELRKKTHRGQLGQKRRGYFVGEVVFGYKSYQDETPCVGSGGGPRSAGVLMRVNPDEASVVLRIFEDFADGKPLTAIARALNQEGVPGRYKSSEGWTASTLGRTLDNTKYIGEWVWNKMRGVRDPDTGCRHAVLNPESEWVVVKDEALRIIPKRLWTRVRCRRKEIRLRYEAGENRRGYSAAQGRRVDVYPTHLLSGTMQCASCGGAIGIVGGKRPGYYGCIAKMRSACDNSVLVQRPVAEKIILGALSRQLRDPKAFARILRSAEKEARRLFREVPDALRLKRRELKGAVSKQKQYLRFISEGYQSKTVVDALAEVEPQVDRLRHDVAELERASKASFRAPSVAWVSQRLGKIRSVLEQRVARSAILFRRLAGPIKLVPVRPPTGRRYYMAHMSLDTLALLDDPESDADSDSGSKPLHWWRRRESNPRPRIRPHRNLHAYPRLLFRHPCESAAKTAGG